MVALHAPEGECIVLNYRISGDFDLPFRFYPVIEEVTGLLGFVFCVLCVFDVAAG